MRPRAEAEKGSRAKDRFLVFVSHELKTPLSVILDWLHLVRTGKLRDAQIPAALETIERNTRVQVKLVADLLDVAGAVRGKETAIAMHEVDVSEVVRHVVEDRRRGPAAHLRGLSPG